MSEYKIEVVKVEVIPHPNANKFDCHYEDKENK